MYYNKLFKDFKKNNFSNLYVFHGKEKYILDKLIEYIANNKVIKDYKDFNFHVIEFDEEKVDSLISKCQTLPLFDDNTFIIVKEAYLFNKSINDNAKDKIINYFNNLNPKSILIFITDKVDKRTSIYKEGNKHGEVVNLRSLNKNELSKWIKKYLKQKNIKIDAKTLSYLITVLDYSSKNSDKDLYNLAQDLDKLADFVSKKKRLEKEDIDKMIKQPLERDIFKLVDSIAGNDSQRAIDIFNGLHESGEPLLQILFMITRQFRLIYKMKVLIDTGMTSRNAGNILNLPNFVANKVSRQARNFDYDTLKIILDKCINVDKTIKRSGIDNKIIIESFIGELFFLIKN